MEEEKRDNFSGYSSQAMEMINDPQYCGRMNDPSSASYLKGPCGDAMEFYLVIEDGKIAEAKYHADGCPATRACGAMTAKLARGKTVGEALAISAGEVIAELEGLPPDHRHCSILAVSAFYRAIADYLLRD